MLIILTTHPIQYQVPLWKALAHDGRVPFEVWYLTRHNVEVSHDQEFGKNFTWDIELLAGYPHRFLDVASAATPTTFWKCRLRERLVERLRTCGARVLWVQGWQVSAYWQAVWDARRAGVEVWLRGESNDLAPTPAWKQAIKRVFLGQFFRRVDRFLYIGAANKRLYRKFGVPETKLYPAPYAVDNERFAKQAEAIRGQRSEVRSQWEIPNDAFCILFCGKFISKKRPLDLVKAAQLLISNNQLPNLHLLFVGSGQLGNQLRANCQVISDAESPEVPNNEELITDNQKTQATFAGFLNQTEISKAYVAADCLVLPSDYGETWGLVVNEAMASGLPCIISDKCGCAEDLGNTSANMVFSCGSSNSLVEQLKRMLERNDQRRRLAPEIDRFSFARTVSTVCNIYDRYYGGPALSRNPPVTRLQH